MHNGQGEYKVRPFDWRDLLLVQRLQGRGQVLDYQRAQVDGVFPLRDALHTYLPLSAGRRHTLVMAGSNAFAQYICHRKSDWVRLTYLAPTPTRAQHAKLWVDLLEQLTMAVGEQGMHHIVAEARHDGPELELLQSIGFGVFARQVLLRRTSPLVRNNDLPPLPGLRPWRSTDDWGARLLHTNVVPKLVQQIEASVEDAFSPSCWSNRLVLARDAEIVACVATRRGRVGSAMRLLVHPQADVPVEALIHHGLATLSDVPQQPVYCRVRRYEGWLQAPLEACGFEPGPQTVLLVKHTVARVLTPAWNRLSLVEGQTEATTSIVSSYQKLGIKKNRS